jgi:DnaJ-domain-containing protein 1
MMTSHNPPPSTAVEQAMKTFNLTAPFSQETLNQQYEEARRIWHPSRYAGLTNNPGKYMEMYKKGEAKTKEIHAAYQLLLTYLNTQQKT